MAEEPSTVNAPPCSPRFLEVICKISGNKHRFAAGSKSGFAVSVINGKLNSATPRMFYIEAVKEGEEPISFGPDALLVDFGSGWKLQTVSQLDVPGTEIGKSVHQRILSQIPTVSLGSDGLNPIESGMQQESKAGINVVYIGKILVAFGIMFMIGALFTLALENLPRLILFINSSM